MGGYGFDEGAEGGRGSHACVLTPSRLDGFGLGNQPEVNRQALGTTGALDRCRFPGKLGSGEANAIRARMRVAACGLRSLAKLADVNLMHCAVPYCSWRARRISGNAR